METQTGREAAGRGFGVVLLAIGAVLLLLVFGLALRAFSGLPAAFRAAGAATLEGTGRVLAQTAAQTLLLFVMAYAASLLASKGLESLSLSSRSPK